MEQLTKEGCKKELCGIINENNTTAVKNRILFNLKEERLVQKVLINALLCKTNYFIDDLAKLLHIDAKKLNQVWAGKGKLNKIKSMELVSLFYIILN